MQRPIIPITTLTRAVRLPGAVRWRSAATPIDQTRPLDPRGTHRNRQPQGPHPGARLGPQRGAHHRFARQRRREARHRRRAATTSTVRAQYPKQMGAWRGDRTGPTDLILQVPLRADLDIDSVSADIDVDGVAPGDLSVDTVSGEVRRGGGAAACRHQQCQRRPARHAQQRRRQSRDRQRRRRRCAAGSTARCTARRCPGNLSIDSNGERLRRLSADTVSGDSRGAHRAGRRRRDQVRHRQRRPPPAPARSLSARVSAESFSGRLPRPGARSRKKSSGRARASSSVTDSGRARSSWRLFPATRAESRRCRIDVRGVVPEHQAASTRDRAAYAGLAAADRRAGRRSRRSTPRHATPTTRNRRP